VTSLFLLADQLEVRLSAAQRQVDALTLSLLAFSGQLVSQDPNDEPADKLLERIKRLPQRGVRHSIAATQIPNHAA
jgi:type I restriction enzyme, S subunit